MYVSVFIISIFCTLRFVFFVFFFFFFSSRRRHTRCALVTGVQTCALPFCQNRWIPASSAGYYDDNDRWISGAASGHYDQRGRWVAGVTVGHYDASGRWIVGAAGGRRDANGHWVARKSVGVGKRVSVRVDLGGRRFIQKKSKKLPTSK